MSTSTSNSLHKVIRRNEYIKICCDICASPNKGTCVQRCSVSKNRDNGGTLKLICDHPTRRTDPSATCICNSFVQMSNEQIADEMGVSIDDLLAMLSLEAL